MDIETRNLNNDVDPEVWLDRYGDALYRFALIRVGNEHLAEDLVQETLVSAVRSLKTYSGRSGIKTWLTSILRRRIADHYRRIGQRTPVQLGQFDARDQVGHDAFADRHADLFHPKMSAELFQSSLEKDEFWNAVRSCIDELPVHFREAFVMRMFDEDKSIESICKELDLTKNNLAVRLYRARLILRQCFERYWLQGESPS